jgi:hypothetical protein
MPTNSSSQTEDRDVGSCPRNWLDMTLLFSGFVNLFGAFFVRRSKEFSFEKLVQRSD